MSTELQSIYGHFVRRTGRRLRFLEECLGEIPSDSSMTEDDLRNVPATYAKVFSDSSRDDIEGLFQDALGKMKTRTFEESEDVLDSLSFMQEVIATALWKYHLRVGPVLEQFARDFDRIDLRSERERLFQIAQRKQFSQD